MFTLKSVSNASGGLVSLIDDPFQNILTNVKLPAKVEMLLLHHDPPLWLNGTLLDLDEKNGDLLSVQLTTNSNPIVVPFGAKIILHFANNAGPMLSLNYYDQQDGILKLQFSQVHRRDKRIFPRHYGNIPLKFREVSKEEEELAIKQWLAKVTDVDDRWSTPEPFMNFSLGGLSFESSTPIDAGTLLLLEIRIGQSKEIWRATSRIVRCIEIPEKNYELAIEFQDLPEGALEALSELTLKVQEALL